jgi:hypothetical protein
MTEIPMAEAEIGDVLAKEFCDGEGRILLPVGAKLGPTALSLMLRRGVQTIVVTREGDNPDFAIPEVGIKIYHLEADPDQRAESYAVAVGAAEAATNSLLSRLYMPLRRLNMQEFNRARLRLEKVGPIDAFNFIHRGEKRLTSRFEFYGLGALEKSAVQRALEGKTPLSPPCPLDVERAKLQGKIAPGAYQIRQSRLYVAEETKVTSAHVKLLKGLKPQKTYILYKSRYLLERNDAVIAAIVDHYNDLLPTEERSEQESVTGRNPEMQIRRKAIGMTSMRAPSGEGGGSKGGEEDTEVSTPYQRFLQWDSYRTPQPKRRCAPGGEQETDVVGCSVFAPPEAQPGDTVFVQGAVHVPEQRAAARQSAKEADEEAQGRGYCTLDLEIERGARLAFELTMPGMVIDEPWQESTWRGPTRPQMNIDLVQFGVQVPKNTKPGNVVGKLEISINTVPIGRVKFQLKVANARMRSAAVPNPAALEATHYTKAFLSYSSQDREEVLKRAQMLTAVGIDYFQDVQDLKPGARWAEELYSHIDLCDLFLLFWSSAARDSEWVSKEVNYALERQYGDDFAPPEIRPVLLEGPPVPEPPEELAGLHFNDRVLYLM